MIQLFHSYRHSIVVLNRNDGGRHHFLIEWTPVEDNGRRHGSHSSNPDSLSATADRGSEYLSITLISIEMKDRNVTSNEAAEIQKWNRRVVPHDSIDCLCGIQRS